jgi:cytochrome bd-type quinol oxidase subunit 2
VLAIDLVVAIVLTLPQVATSGYSVFLNFFLGFAFDACSDPNLTCNYSLGTAALFIVPVVAVVVLAATILLVVRNRRKSRLGWWIPLAGMAAAYLSLGIAIALTNIATGQSML